MTFSYHWVKRWSAASIVLSWMAGLISGMTLIALKTNPNPWILLVMIPFYALMGWFLLGEEKEWIENDRMLMEPSGRK